MVLAEQSGNAQYAPGSPEEPAFMLAQDIVWQMRQAVDGPLQANQGHEARELFMEMGEPLSQTLQGPDAHKTITMLQEMVSTETSEKPAYSSKDPIMESHIKSAGASMVLLMLSKDLIHCANNTADPTLAEAAVNLLFDASATLPKHTDCTTLQFLAGRLPEIVHDAVAKVEKNPVTIRYRRDVDDDGPVDHYPDILRVTNHFNYIAGHAAPETRAEMFRLFQEIDGRAAESPYWQAAAEDIYEEGRALETFEMLTGIPARDLSDAWSIGYGLPKNANCDERISMDEYIQTCLKRMVALEIQEPGICNYLYRVRGMRNFGRYPEALLLSQYRNRDKPYTERMYFISGTDDDNGSAVYNSMPKIHRAIDELETIGVGGILVEIDKKQELKVRARLAHMAGWPPTRYVFIDAHGDYGEVTFGEYVNTRDILNWLGSLIIETTAKDGTVIINSCRAAASPHPDLPSFAETAHIISAREIQGTRAGTWLKSLEVYTDTDGKPHIAADMRYSKKWEYTPGKPAIVYGAQPRAPRSEAADNTQNTAANQTIEQLATSVRTAIAAIPISHLEAAAKIVHSQHLDFRALSQGTGKSSPLERAISPVAETTDTIDTVVARLQEAVKQLQTYLRGITG